LLFENLSVKGGRTEPTGWGSRTHILSTQNPDREFNRLDKGFSAIGRYVFYLPFLPIEVLVPTEPACRQAGAGQAKDGLSNGVNVEGKKQKDERR